MGEAPTKGRLAYLLAGLALLVVVAGAAQTVSLLRAGDADRWRAERKARITAGLEAINKLGDVEADKLARSRERHLLYDAVADCVTYERVGNRGDGGKWVCNPYKIRPPCVVYGVGAGSEITFDEEMASRFGCEVHVFDPSPAAVRRFGGLAAGKKLGAGSVTFHPWGLGPVSADPAKARELVIGGKACEVKTLDEIAAALGHKKIDVLKMDIEGGELTVIPSLLEKKLLRTLGINQVLAEVHTMKGPDFQDFVRLHAGLANAGFLVVRKELNPYVADLCAEYAFADVDYLLD